MNYKYTFVALAFIAMAVINTPVQAAASKMSKKAGLLALKQDKLL